MDIRRTDGVGVISWRFEHEEWTFLLSYATPSGWTFDASDEALKYTPRPSIEVRRARRDTAEFRTIDRIPLPWTDRRRTAPDEVLEATVSQYITSLTK